MAAKTDETRGATTVSVHRDVRDRLKSLKPYDSMSMNELLDEMADQYEENV